MQARKGLEGREEEGKREGRFLVLFFVGFLSIFCRFVTVFFTFFVGASSTSLSSSSSDANIKSS